MNREAIIIFLSIISMIAGVVVIPEVRQWSCVHLGWLCSGSNQKSDDQLWRQPQPEDQRIALAERERQAAEVQRKADEQRLAETRRRQLKVEAVNKAEEQKLALNSFDGIWFSDQYRYGFRIEGKLGIATVSNSPSFSPGDPILRFERVSDVAFRGDQIFANGKWYQISGQLIDQRTLRMEGGGLVWTMSRR